MRIKKGDTVLVLKGKDRGKTSKVLRVYGVNGRALVEGVNYIKKHARKRTENEQAGIVQMESPIQVSNLMLVCSKCGKPSRVKMSLLADGSKVRVCKKCNEVFV